MYWAFPLGLCLPSSFPLLLAPPPYPNKHKAGCWPAASSDSCSLAPQLMEAYLLVAPKPSMASTVSAGARGPARRCLVVAAATTKVILPNQLLALGGDGAPNKL